MKKTLISCDTTVIKRCIKNKDIVKNFDKETYPFIIPSIVRDELVGVLTKEYRNKQRAVKDVRNILKKLNIRIKKTTKNDIEHGVKKYQRIKRERKGKRIGKKDCIILTSMKRLKVSDIIVSGDKFLTEEAKRMKFKVRRI